MAQPRCDHLGEESFEPAVPLLVGRIAIRVRRQFKPGPSAGRGEIGERRGERIDACPRSLTQGADRPAHSLPSSLVCDPSPLRIGDPDRYRPVPRFDPAQPG